MSEEDFRALMTSLETAETERDILRQMLDAERSKQDDYAEQVDNLNLAFDQERWMWKNRLKRQERQKPFWGLLGLGLGIALAQ